MKTSKNRKLTEKKSAEEKTFPRSYKLDPHIFGILSRIHTRANKLSPKRVSEARLIKALIILSRDISDEKLLEGLKEVW